MNKIISDRSPISSDDEVESKKEIDIESTDEEDFDAYSEVNVCVVVILFFQMYGFTKAY